MTRLSHLPLFKWLPLAVVIIAGVYPLLRLLLVPVFPALAPPQVATDVDDSMSIAAIGNSLRIGAEAGVAALLPGFAIGYVLERYDWPGARLLGGALWLLLLTPSFLLCAGWQLFVIMPPTAVTPLYRLLFSEAGIVAMLTLKALPFAALAARAAWATIGGQIGAALRIHVRAPWRRTAILGQLLLPAAGAVFAVAFIEGIADFGIAATLGAHLRMPLVIYGIYAALARTPVDFVRAAALSLVLITLAALAVAVNQYLLARAGVPTGRSQPPARHQPGAGGKVGTGFAIGTLVACAFAVPATGLFDRAFSSPEPTHLRAQEWLSLIYSSCYAFTAATLGLTMALCLLALAGGVRRAAVGRLIDFATLGAMAVPGIVLGGAYVIAFNGAVPLYGTPFLLILGLIMSHVPMLVRFLQVPLARVQTTYADAGALHGMGRRRRIEQIHTPLLMRPLLWGWALVFGGVFFDLPLASLMYPIGRAPIGVQLLSLDETLRFTDEARLALAGIALCVGIVGTVVIGLPRWLIGPTVAPVLRSGRVEA